MTTENPSTTLIPMLTPREALIECLALAVERDHEAHVTAYAVNRVKTYGWQLPEGSTGQESEPVSMATCIQASDAFDSRLREALNQAFDAGKKAGEAAQLHDAAPNLGDAWKHLLLNGVPLERDKYGCGYHPALPNFDEGVNGRTFFAVFGIELKTSMADNEMESDAYEAMTEFGFTEDGPNYNVWNPERPKGEGWHLVAIFDTEDGPACWWLREKSPTKAQRQDEAAVDELAERMKAKLEQQREKGYSGWNNKRQCTQQHLSNLLREHVGKGDPVDVANFCAFLQARGEGIAAAPQSGLAAKVIEALEMLESGALNFAENAKNRGDDYDVGYAKAMAKMARDTFNVLSAPAHPAEGVPASNENAAFEAWARGQFFVPEKTLPTSQGYNNSSVQDMWEAWKARAALVATQPAAQVLDAKDCDMFWVVDDPDQNHDTLHDAVVRAYEDGGLQTDSTVEIQCAKCIGNVVARITSTDPLAFELLIDAELTAQADQGTEMKVSVE